MAPPKTTKDGFAAVAGALRKAIQELLAPELKQHTKLLRQHGGTLAAVLSVLHEQNHAFHEQSEISREQGERLARIEGELVGVHREAHEQSQLLRDQGQVLREHGESLSGLRGEMVEVRGELHEHNQILRAHSEILREHSQSLIGLRGEATELRGELRSFEDRVIDAFNKLDGRLARTEDKLDVRERLVVIEGRLAALENREPR